MTTQATWLKSRTFWLEHQDWLGKKTPGYKFPGTLAEYNDITGGKCPFGQGFKQWEHHGESVYCICALLEWMDKATQFLPEFEAQWSPADMNDLKPFKGHPSARAHNAQMFDEGIKDLEYAKKYFLGTDKFRGWLKNPNKSVFLQGNTGNGKTQILRHIKAHYGPFAMYLNAGLLQQRLFDILDDKSSMREYINPITYHPILIIDDFGAATPSPFVLTQFYNIIDVRYSLRPNYPTIVTTNEDIYVLKSNPSLPMQRLVGRITDYDTVKTLILHQPSYRDEVNHGGPK